MPYKYGAGWQPPELPQYEEPEKVRDQRTQEDLKSMVSKQAEMRYGPAMEELPRQHAQMQRQGQEAMAAKGLAGTGISTRESLVPIAQQNQRMLADILQEKGLFKQTAYDELEMRERDRTDQLLQQNFANWIAQKQLEGSLTQDDFGRWLSTQQHGLSQQQFAEAVRQFGQTHGLARDRFEFEKEITEKELERQQEGGLYPDFHSGMDAEGWFRAEAEKMIGGIAHDAAAGGYNWSYVEEAIKNPEIRQTYSTGHLSEEEALVIAFRQYEQAMSQQYAGVGEENIPEDFLKDLLKGKEKIEQIENKLMDDDDRKAAEQFQRRLEHLKEQQATGKPPSEWEPFIDDERLLPGD